MTKKFSLHVDRPGREYINSHGHSLVIFDNYKPELGEAFLNEGKGYIQLNVSGKSQSGEQAHYSVKRYGVPYYERHGDLYISHTEGVALFTKFSKHLFFGKCRIIAERHQDYTSRWSENEPLFFEEYETLPDWDSVLHLVKDDDGSLYCFYKKTFNSDYTIHVLKKHQDSITTGTIKTWDVYRDGGTTLSKTSFGDFYFPTAFRPELKPKKDEIEVSPLEITDETYKSFNLKTESKTFDEAVEDATRNLGRAAHSKIERAILKQFDVSETWISEETKKEILSKVSMYQFEKFLKTVK